MGVTAGLGALFEGATAAEAFALPAEIAAGVEAGIAEAGLGALGAEAGAAGLGAVEAGTLGLEGLGAAELAAASVPELAAPVAAGAAEAGALAPAAGALAPSVASPAISGLSTVASEAIPGAIAEGAGVAPLTELAAETAAPGLAAPAADALATPLAPEAATASAAAAPTVEATAPLAAPETGLSSLAQGAPQVMSDAAPIGSEGSQLAQTATTGAQTTGSSGAAVPPTATTSMNPTPPTFAQPGAQQVVSNLAQSEAPLTPTAPSAPLAPAPAPAPEVPGPVDVGSATSYVKNAANAGGEGLTGSISNAAGKAGDWLAKNPMSVLSGLGMAYNMMKGQQPPKYSAELQAQAAALQAQGAQLQGYLTSGTLPPGIGAALSGAHDSAAAAIRSRYANTGMSGSSAEMQDLNNLAQTTVSQGADIANKLLATGVSEQQFASGLYQNLMATAMQQDTNMSNAISNFTGALARSSVQPRPV